MKLTLLKEINPIKDMVIEVNKLFNSPIGFLRVQENKKQTRTVNDMKSESVAVEELNHKEGIINETGNAALDLYCLEGMKLFNQGEFAKNIQNKKNDLGVYL